MRKREVISAITVRGGLGNQLFQWGLACELRSRGVTVRLDASCLRTTPFALRGLAEEPRAQHSYFRRAAFLERLRLPPSTLGWKVLLEPGFHYHPQILNDPADHTVLHGYWQSARYWPNVADRVAADVRAWALAQLTPSGLRTAKEMSNCVSGVMHVRRGDYAEEGARRLHGLLDATYFRAERDLARRNGVERFFVFSNDQKWCASKLAASDTTFVQPDVASGPAGEIALMSLGAHHALSNSSFSWWGAWLSERGGEVVTPQVWFRDPSMDTSDLIPTHWRRSRIEPT